MRPLPRSFAAAGLFSSWMVLLLLGYAGGGLVHLLLLGALLLFPWGALRSSDPAPHHDLPDLEEES